MTFSNVEDLAIARKKKKLYSSVHVFFNFHIAHFVTSGEAIMTTSTNLKPSWIFFPFEYFFSWVNKQAMG